MYGTVGVGPIGLKDRATMYWRQESNGGENEGHARANQQLDLGAAGAVNDWYKLMLKRRSKDVYNVYKES